MKNKVKEVQEYLSVRGIEVSEVAIVDAAIDMIRMTGAGLYSFVCEFERREKR
jgi:hypothetical protein